MSVSEETAVSLMVSWTPPNAHVLQYRVTYAALTGAEGHDNTVSLLRQTERKQVQRRAARLQYILAVSRPN